MRVLVLGLGSVLMGDDAAGPWVVEWLGARYALPPEVTLLDGGTPGPELFHYLEGFDAVIFVDTVHAAAPPGSLHLYRGVQLTGMPHQPRLSPHDPSLRDALLTAQLTGRGPREALLIGVVPERVGLPLGLTPSVRAAVPQMAERVAAELSRMGCPLQPLDRPRSPAPWWEPGLEAQGQGFIESPAGLPSA